MVNGKISQTTHVLWDPFQTKTIWEDPRATMDASGTLYITGTHVKLTDHDYGKYIPVIAKISLGDFVSTLDPQMLEASLREIPRIGKNALVIPGQNGQKNRALVRLDGEEKRQQRKRLTRFSVYEEQQDGEWTETGVIDFKSVLPKPKDTYRIGTGGGPIFLDNGDVAIGTHRIIWEKGVYKYILGVSVLGSDLHPYAWFDLADYDFLKGRVDQDPDMAHVPRHNPIGKQVVYSVDMHYVLKNDGTEDHEQLECLVTMFDNSIVKLRFSKRELLEKAQRARELVQNQVSPIGTLRRGTGLNPLELRIVD
ncbi:MAG: hypothetical protein KGJ07_06900 [Patescibacteria group bacterium]|nr:hypothetical protein [Patescibacteria group bacterium]